LFARRDEILAARIYPDAARLCLGRKIGDIGKIAGSRRAIVNKAILLVVRSVEYRNLPLGVTLNVSRPDFWLVVLRRGGGGRRGGPHRRLRAGPRRGRPPPGPKSHITTQGRVALSALPAYLVAWPH